MFIVTVRFRIEPAHAEAFRRAMVRQAQTSVAAEPGCRLFDVCLTRDADSEFFLYEVYDDPAAFDAHLASEHFKLFDAEVAPWILEKQVWTHIRIQT